MLHSFFVEQLKRLVSAFGDKAVNEEKSRLLWARFKEIDESLFVQVVDYLILNQRQTPVLDDFNRAVFSAREQIRKISKPQSFDTVCVTCSGSGWILSTPIGQIIPIAEKCDCTTFEKSEYSDFYVSAFSDEERSAMVRTCIDRIKGSVPDAEWNQFQKDISEQILIHEKQKGPRVTFSKKNIAL